MKQVVTLFMVMVVSSMMLWPLTARGEVYQYEDDNGIVNFTDDPGKIPRKMKNKHRIVDDEVRSDESVMRVKISGNQVLVPVTVAYRGKEVQATFLLDTGATTCTISPELAARLNVNPADSNASLAQGVGGAVFVVGHNKLDYVVVGPNRKYDVEVSIISSGINDGLLGMNFLRELRYHVDFDTHTIKWGD